MTARRLRVADAEADGADEVRDAALVVYRALCLVEQYWRYNADRYPPAHPYRQAANMVLAYIQRRYLP